MVFIKFSVSKLDGLYNRETEAGYPLKSFSEQSFKKLVEKLIMRMSGVTYK